MTRHLLDDRTQSMLSLYFDDPIELDDIPPSLAARIADGIAAENGGGGTTRPALPSTEVTPPTPLHRAARNPTHRSWLVAAACVAVALMAAVFVTTLGGPDPDLRAMTLEPLEDQGVAEVRLDAGGRTGGATMMLAVDGVTVATDEYLELWLLGDPGDQPISLGEAQDGTHTLPADADLSRYRTVDVSVEKSDGDAAHSGRSVFRGDLGPLV